LKYVPNERSSLSFGAGTAFGGAHPDTDYRLDLISMALFEKLEGFELKFDEADVVALTLDNIGMIRDCTESSEALFRYPRTEMIERHVSLLLPELGAMELVRDGEPNQHLRFQCRIGHRFSAMTRDGQRFPSKLFLNVLDSRGEGRLSLIIRPAQPFRQGEARPWAQQRAT
jgi:PAS domain-containing protein